MKKITELFTKISGLKLTKLTPKSLDDYAYFQNHFLCKDLNLTPGLINNCFWRLQEMIDNYERCFKGMIEYYEKGIQSNLSCRSQNQHWTPYYYYGQIMFQTVSCPFDKQNYKKSLFLKRISLTQPSRGLYLPKNELKEFPAEFQFSFGQRRFCEFFINAQDSKNSFYLYGPSGCGKSFVNLAIVKELIMQGKKVFYLNIPDLQDLLYQSINIKENRIHYEKLQNDLNEADYVFLDDLGKENGKKFFYRSCFALFLKKFHYFEKKVIFISNFSPEQYFEYIKYEIDHYVADLVYGHIKNLTKENVFYYSKVDVKLKKEDLLKKRWQQRQEIYTKLKRKYSLQEGQQQIEHFLQEMEQEEQSNIRVLFFVFIKNPSRIFKLLNK